MSGPGSVHGPWEWRADAVLALRDLKTRSDRLESGYRRHSGTVCGALIEGHRGFAVRRRGRTLDNKFTALPAKKG